MGSIQDAGRSRFPWGAARYADITNLAIGQAAEKAGRSSVERGQAHLQVVGRQGADNAVKVSVDHRREVIDAQFDAMVGDPVLRKVVGANLLIALACSHLGLA